jgi:hypothetical protein
MAKINYLLLACFAIPFAAFGQNVGIGTAVPQPSALLDLSDTQRALRLTRADTASINLLSPVQGLLTFQPTDSLLYYHDGDYWRPLGAPQNPVQWYNLGSTAALVSSAASTEIPGLSQVITVPAGGANVQITSYGSFVGGGMNQSASLDFTIRVNGGLLRFFDGGRPGGFVTATVYNSGTFQNVGHYNLSQTTYFPAGTYTISIQTARRAGNMFPSVGGDSASAFQCVLTIGIFPPNP